MARLKDSISEVVSEARQKAIEARLRMAVINQQSISEFEALIQGSDETESK